MPKIAYHSNQRGTKMKKIHAVIISATYNHVLDSVLLFYHEPLIASDRVN